MAIGWTVIGVGLFGVFDHPGSANAFKVFRLLVGLNVVNDAVVIPTLLLLAFAVRRLAPRWLIDADAGLVHHGGRRHRVRLPHGGRLREIEGESQHSPARLCPQPAHRPWLHYCVQRAPSRALLAQGTFYARVNQTARVRGRTLSVGRGLVVVISLAPTLVYLFVALHRIGYPYELEWLEGGAAEIAGRVAHGQAIYVAPSIHYVPYPYTPLYFWVTGTLARLTGVGFLPLRLVSLISSLGVCALLVRIVWRETGDLVAGVVASGLFTATFAVSGAWLDIGRVDSMAAFLLLAALHRARHARGISGGIVVGLLAFLAFMTKQSTLLAMAPVLAGTTALQATGGVGRRWPQVAVLVVGSTYLLDASSHGWYGYYAFQELLHQGEVSSVWRTFFTKDLWHVPWAIGLGLAALAVCVLYRRVAPTDWLYWGSAIGGLALLLFGIEAAFGRRAGRADPGLCGDCAHGSVWLPCRAPGRQA